MKFIHAGNARNTHYFITPSTTEESSEEISSADVTDGGTILLGEGPFSVPKISVAELSNSFSTIESMQHSSFTLNIILSLMNESFSTGDGSSYSVNLYNSIVEDVNIIDGLLITLTEYLSEDVGVHETLLDYHSIIKLANENLKLNFTLQNIANYTKSVNDLIEYISQLAIVKQGILDDDLAITDDLSNVIIAYFLHVSSLTVSSTTQSDSIALLVSDESVNIDGSLTSSSLTSLLLNDALSFIIGDTDSDKYISYLLEPETFSTSTYSNYNFSQSTKFNNKYIFSNKDGLYEYGSEYDDGEIITARIQTAALDFGTSNLKQMPYFYIGVTNSNKLVLKLSVDGKASVYYKLNKKTDYLSNQKISIGKGLIGRYFQFELITEENTDFNMESIEFTPLVLRRKL